MGKFTFWEMAAFLVFSLFFLFPVLPSAGVLLGFLLQPNDMNWGIVELVSSLGSAYSNQPLWVWVSLEMLLSSEIQVVMSHHPEQTGVMISNYYDICARFYKPPLRWGCVQGEQLAGDTA